MHVSRKDSLIYFDDRRLKMELTKILRSATAEVKNLLQETVTRNASKLPMKSNLVSMASGRTTSDSDRQEALIASITGDRVGTFFTTWESVSLGAYVGAMETNFEDSHVGWYYEVGTGEKSNENLYNEYGLTASLGDENPYRLKNVGAPIVSRSIEDNNGEWTDFGGNVRQTSSRVGGIGGDKIPEDADGKPIATPQRYAEIKDKFRKNIGEDIQAYEWYRKAVEEVSEEVLSIYTNAIRDFNILDPKYKILVVKEEYIIGTRW